MTHEIDRLLDIVSALYVKSSLVCRACPHSLGFTEILVRGESLPTSQELAQTVFTLRSLTEFSGELRKSILRVSMAIAELLRNDDE